MGRFNEFLELVTKNFEFLEREYGFKIRPDNSRESIYYDSISNQIQIFWGYTSQGELDLGVRPPKSELSSEERPSKAVDIVELMAISDATTIGTYYSPFPNSVEELKVEIEKLASLLKKYGEDWLGDKTSFASIYKQKQILANDRESLEEIIRKQRAYYDNKYPPL
jgi:hypothetical protein